MNKWERIQRTFFNRRADNNAVLLFKKSNYPHFTKKETEAQQVPCLGPYLPLLLKAEPELTPKSVCLRKPPVPTRALHHPWPASCHRVWSLFPRVPKNIESLQSISSYPASKQPNE